MKSDNSYSICTSVLIFYALLLESGIVFIRGEHSVVLDKKSDIFMVWKLKGSFSYYSDGVQFESSSTHRDRLPADFDFIPFRTTKGIWVIPNALPLTKLSANNIELDRGGETMITASFSFQSAAQLMDSVSVRHCLYGNARIFIKQGQHVSFTIAPSESVVYEWIETNIPLHGTSQFVVEAVVQNSKDVVLIDRIEGFYLEVTTSTTPRPKTSPRTHPPKSATYSFRINSNNFLILVLITVLMSLQQGARSI